MTASPPTAAKMLADLRRAGVVLTANGDRLAFDAPAGAMTPAVRAMLKARKPELLAVLRGDYLNAAAAMVLSHPDPEQRAELAYLFDERAGICQYDGGMSRSEAERIAYGELHPHKDHRRCRAQGRHRPERMLTIRQHASRLTAWAGCG